VSIEPTRLSFEVDGLQTSLDAADTKLPGLDRISGNHTGSQVVLGIPARRL
jgi:hypothetical protein